MSYVKNLLDNQFWYIKSSRDQSVIAGDISFRTINEVILLVKKNFDTIFSGIINSSS